MWKWFSLLLAYAIAQQQPQWDVGGNIVGADPCVANLQLTGTAGSQDCQTLPLPSVTFFAPTLLAAGTFTVRGQNLQAGITYGLAYPGLDCSFGADPATVLAINAGGTATMHTINPTTWFPAAAELQTVPRKICANLGGWRYTGLGFAVVSGCSATQACPQNVEPAGSLLTPAAIAARRAQNTCCQSTTVTPLLLGTCINPRLQACCDGLPYNPNVEKCCFYTHPVHNIRVRRLSPLSDPCPCYAAADCAANTGENSCCLASKYTELNPAITQAPGQCFNPVAHRCCNTGQRFDPGSQQCCTISGLQSVDSACPCSIDTDCRGAQTSPAPATGAQVVPSSPSPIRSTFVCCKQTAPVPMEPERCNVYSNYPSGTGTQHACNGRCIDSTYQICCNGAVCRREFEQCCNATCCNLYTSTCSSGLYSKIKTGAVSNWNEYLLQYDTCTDVEQLSTVKSFWVFLLPSFLLLATLIVFAIGLVFVHKAATREFLAIEKLQIGFGIAAIILACPLYFAPVYKYGVVTVVVAVFEILVAAAPFLRLRILGVFAMGLLLLYLFDPFHGNHYLTLASGRTLYGNPDPETAGLWYTTGKSWRDFFNVPDGNYCTQWYGGYFRYDPNLQDYNRFSNPHIQNFGYCGRGWITTLLIVEGALLAVSAVLFLTSLLSAILPFKVAYDPIELEVRGTGSVLEYTR